MLAPFRAKYNAIIDAKGQPSTRKMASEDSCRRWKGSNGQVAPARRVLYLRYGTEAAIRWRGRLINRMPAGQWFMSRILIADPIAAEGIDLLKGRAQVDVKHGLAPGELAEILGEYDALVVRSETKVTADVIRSGKRLQVIARAGIGVDNIDLEAATGAGIAVVNAPTGNTVAAAEHTLALMLALSRNIPSAHQSLLEGQWRRSAFVGIEVRNKTLGIAGLGRVGTEVARRAPKFRHAPAGL